MTRTLQQTKARAVQLSLLPPTTLGRAVTRLGFVQADPIRAPARAQDLMLRHRVSDYRLGDLDRHFVRLGIEEDFLYAYGFMPRATHRLIHPRRDLACADGTHVPAGLAAEVLAFVRERGIAHPRDLHAAFGGERAVNGWGGLSQATTSALKTLHFMACCGSPGGRTASASTASRRPMRSRIRRGASAPAGHAGDAHPVPDLRAEPARHAESADAGRAGLGRMHDTVLSLLKTGELERAEALDGEAYLWPAGLRAGQGAGAADTVRFLAPFEPGGMGPAPVRPSVGLGISFRGLHAAGAAPVRLLCDADPVAQRGDRLDQYCGPGRKAGVRGRLRQLSPQGSRFPPGIRCGAGTNGRVPRGRFAFHLSPWRGRSAQRSG